MSTSVKCTGCDRDFPTARAIELHQSGSTICPKSSKYDEAIAKEKDTKCPHCQLPCRGEEGVKAHLRRSKTCPGGNLKSKTPEERKAERKERKPAAEKTEKKPVSDKKDAKVEKKTDKKDAKVEKKTDKKDAKVEKKTEKKPAAEKKTTEKTERVARTPLPKDTKCEGCSLSFRGEKGVSIHQASSTVCPKSAKYSKEAAEAAKARSAKKDAANLDTKCPHCESSHNGKDGLETHLAKSLTCPKSAKYDPTAKPKVAAVKKL